MSVGNDSYPSTVPQLLRQARQISASDLHLRVGLPPMVRVHGELKPLPNLPVITEKPMTNLLAPVLGDSDSPHRRTIANEKSVDFSFMVEGVGRFRVSMFLERRRLAAVFRHIPEEVPTLDKINTPKSLLKFLELHRGLVLVTGPTGSGKSTTLAALIDALNVKRADHILTLEDPIEFVHTPKRSVITQREIGADASSFPHALRAALRQDPDVILIGELRDLETTRIALQAAETGHLVFGTLHTKSAESTVERIIDQFPGDERSFIRIQLAATIEGVVTQALLPTVDGAGRVPAHEVLIVDDATRAAIRSGKSSTEIRNVLQTRANIGCQTMDKALAYWVSAGRVDMQLARERAQNQKEFDTLIGKASRGESLQRIEFVQPEDVPRMMTQKMDGGIALDRPSGPAPKTPPASHAGNESPSGGGISMSDLPPAFEEDD